MLSHAFLRCEKRCIRLGGTPLLGVGANNIVEYFFLKRWVNFGGLETAVVLKAGKSSNCIDLR